MLRRTRIPEIRKEFLERGYELLTNTYRSLEDENLSYTCSCGALCRTSYKKFLMGKESEECEVCNRICYNAFKRYMRESTDVNIKIMLAAEKFEDIKFFFYPVDVDGKPLDVQLEGDDSSSVDESSTEDSPGDEYPSTKIVFHSPPRFVRRDFYVAYICECGLKQCSKVGALMIGIICYGCTMHRIINRAMASLHRDDEGKIIREDLGDDGEFDHLSDDGLEDELEEMMAYEAEITMFEKLRTGKWELEENIEDIVKASNP